MIEHAAIDSPETRAIGHPGYEFVAADCSAVLAAWTSPKGGSAWKNASSAAASSLRAAANC